MCRKRSKSGVRRYSCTPRRGGSSRLQCSRRSSKPTWLSGSSTCRSSAWYRWSSSNWISQVSCREPLADLASQLAQREEGVGFRVRREGVTIVARSSLRCADKVAARGLEQLEGEFALLAATVDEGLRGRKRVVRRVGFCDHETRSRSRCCMVPRREVSAAPLACNAPRPY